ncbi:MAG: bifunctional riboflavin kinase/FAD synthetase [Clostridia bacterium]|nr:bifunctional riboflavin kinase/FAD synthetase [Clostridia bacterium]
MRLILLEIFYGLDNIDYSKKVVTLGNFDGVHLGHKELISKAVSLGKEKNLLSYVVSFYPHPRSFFNEDLKYINTLEEKHKNIKAIGADALVILEFNEGIASLSRESFVKEILYKKLNAQIVVVGFDFLFGKNREGNAENLAESASEYGIEVYVTPPVEVDGLKVSSSLIRECYTTGEVEKAKKFLGYYPKISGEVISGKQLGRNIGFPTANINYDKEQLLPGKGVYGVKICIKEKEYAGIANVGVKPTVKKDDLVEVEVHVIDFLDDIYGENVSVSFLGKIRDEMKFSSLEELKNQIDNDVKTAIKKYCL